MSSEDETVTPPRGSGNIALAEIAREVAEAARRAAFLRKKNPLTMAESTFLDDKAKRLEELAERFEEWPQLSALTVTNERPILVDELVDIKQKLEKMGIIGPYADAEGR